MRIVFFAGQGWVEATSVRGAWILQARKRNRKRTIPLHDAESSYRGCGRNFRRLRLTGIRAL
jgi:hypothetical protein